MFSISDKVVLVDDSPSNKRRRDPAVPSAHCFVKKGGVYVVRDIWLSVVSGDPLIQLTGVPEHTNCDGARIGFNAKRFRKLEEIRAENVAAQSARN